MNIRGKKTAVWCLVLVIALGMMSGCSRDDGGTEPPTAVEYKVDLYFSNNEYVETGDESLDHYLTESRKVLVAEGGNPWLEIMEALKAPESESVGTQISEATAFDDVYVSPEDDALIIVNLKNPVSGASMQESFFIGQIVQTLVGNAHLFEDGQNVDKVQFLVGGEKIESLMGHFDAGEPFVNDF